MSEDDSPNQEDAEELLSLLGQRSSGRPVAPRDEAPLILPLDAFVRSVAINRNVAHTFFLGAGASVSSGIRSAEHCVWEWKRTIFLTNNHGLEKQFSDVSLPSVRQRVQQWLNAEGRFPAEGAPGEYGFFAEACYPIPEDRRRYFASLVQGKTPHVGYQLLGLLADAEIVKTIWTTNFDGMPAKAITSGVSVTPIEVGLDTSERIARQAGRGEVLCVTLHGDYRYDALKNTPRELQEQDAKLRQALIAQASETTFVVVGYSGRDESVLAALEEAYAQKGPGRLYWCGFSEPEPSERICRLLSLARANGYEAYYVPTDGFDDLMLRLGLACLEGEQRDRSLELSSQAATETEPVRAPFAIDSTTVNGLIKSNAFAVEIPSEILQFEADLGPGPGAWKRVREWTAGRAVVAAPHKGKVLALGTIDDVREAFRGRLRGEIERTPITPQELGRHNGAITSLLTEALVRTLAASRALATDGRNLLWLRETSTERMVEGVHYRVHEAALLFLRRYGEKQYLVVKPTLSATTREGGDAPAEVQRELKRAILGKQWNRAFSEAMEAWRKRLFPDGGARLEFPPDSGSTFRFSVASAPEYAKLAIPNAKWSVSVPRDIAPNATYQAIEYEEPPLVFAKRSGDGFIKDTHPVRGVVQNRPYDFALTERGLASGVTVGVVCPTNDAGPVASYLARLHQPIRPDSKQEFLLPYPGFAQAFGVPLDVPGPESTAWVSPSEPPPDAGIREGAAQLGAELIRCIDAIHAAQGPSVVLIYVPTRWAKWEEYELEGEYFNLHHFVKAYAVQKGIATGFLRERTLSKPHQGEILWWLGVSFYAKAMRTPWVLESLGTDVAFMGLGFSIERGRPRGQHVIVGCSHIYSADGRGLRYRLSKLENCVIRRGNPFMSKDDARRMGEHARQLFFESMGALPGRLAIQKRTPFSPDEIEGFREGLAGIEEIDMLEITEDPALRYTATRVYRDSGVQDDAFPVRRGTAVVLDGRHALMWVHGAAEAIQSGKRYYLGKSRIPAPLVITRHAGGSSLSTVAREILGLSKMNWNNPDLYSKAPATIDSSNTIAKIGSLLERFGPLSYDYRLFI
jgi:hypothetical protein